MKKFTTELTHEQGIIYYYIVKKINNDGSNLVDIIVEITEAYEFIPENISDTYEALNSVEKIEVIHFITKRIMRKNK